MSHYMKALAMIAAFALVAACQQQEAEQTGATEETPAVDTETVRQGIESTNDRFEQAMLAGDAAALAGFYTADAVILPPGMPRSEGSDAIRSSLTDFLAEGPPYTAFSLTTDRVILAESGDLATEVGTYTFSGNAPDGTTYEDTGKYLAAWQNVNGEWKMIAETWNSDQMPPAEKGAAPSEGERAPAEETTGTTETTGGSE